MGGDKCPGFAMKGICRSSDRRNPGKARADGGGGGGDHAADRQPACRINRAYWRDLDATTIEFSISIDRRLAAPHHHHHHHEMEY